MDHQIVYFDFDRTLLDTDSLKQEQASRVARITQLSVDQVNDGMKKYIASLDTHLNFNVESYAVFLENLYQVNPGDVLKIYLTDCNYIADFLFPEVLGVLAELKRRGTTMGIFSGAVPGHQKIKIEKTGVLEYIPWKSVIISPIKLESEIVALVPDGAVVIDDDPDIIKGLQKIQRIKPIWINRKSHVKNTEVETIHNLRDLLV